MRRRSTLDQQPTSKCGVLLASDGRQGFSKRAVARAAALSAQHGPVAVVSTVKIHGTRYGLQHPGLMPTKDELAERHGWVASAVEELKRNGVEADGQVAATRKPLKKLADVARVRAAAVVVVDASTTTGIRLRIEGDTGTDLARKLKRVSIAVEIVPAA